MSVDKDVLWGSIPLPSFILDAQDCIQDINPAAELFLNAAARKVSGLPIFDRLAIEAPLDGVLDRTRNGKSPVFIKNVDVSGGQAAPVRCNIQIAPTQDASGQILLMIEPQMMSDSLGTLHPKKSSARSAIGMSEMLSHEIKNPLAGITGAAQLLAMNLNTEQREMTDLIVTESRRIVALLDQVEQFGNLRPPARGVANIHDILARAQKSAAVGFASHLTFDQDFDPSLPATFVDADQIMQVFLNLLKNAAEAVGKNLGKLTMRTYYDPRLRLRRSDGTGNNLPLQIEIIDDGPGLPPEIAAEIFDPFVSGHENGTGLGLALVSKIIADHAGWIAVDSVPGRTMFRVSLPVANAEQLEQSDQIPRG